FSVWRHWQAMYSDGAGVATFKPDADGDYSIQLTGTLLLQDNLYPAVQKSTAALTVKVQPASSAGGGCTALPLGPPAAGLAPRRPRPPPPPPPLVSSTAPEKRRDTCPPFRAAPRRPRSRPATVSPQLSVAGFFLFPATWGRVAPTRTNGAPADGGNIYARSA